MFQAQVFSVWAARIGPTRDWYGRYMPICQYDLSYHVSVGMLWYVLYQWLVSILVRTGKANHVLSFDCFTFMYVK